MPFWVCGRAGGAGGGIGEEEEEEEEHSQADGPRQGRRGYLDKKVYESQRHYDDGKDGRAGNDNDHGGERNEDGAQQHEHGGGQRLVYDVDVLGEAVDDASYGRGVKERLGRVELVGEEVVVQLPGCTNVPHG